MSNLKNILSGKLGNVVFYERKGKLCVRTQAKRIRQTKATKASASLFGKAAAINKGLRSGLGELLLDSNQNSIMLRLNRELFPLVKHNEWKDFIKLSPLDRFQFNEATNIHQRLNDAFIIEWKKQTIELKFSDSNLFKTFKSPKGTTAIYLELAVAAAKKSDGSSTGNYFTSLKLTATHPGTNSIDLPFQLKPGTITIVAAALRYEKISREVAAIISAPKWRPAGIIGACYGKPE